MASARFNCIHLTLLLILAGLLVLENIGEILYACLRSEVSPADSRQLLMDSTSAILAGLLTLSLLALNRALTRRGQQHQTVSLLLADSSRVQEEWQQTFNTMPDLVSVHDREFRVVKANSALCEFLGRKPEEIIGRFCYQLFHNRDSPIDGCPHDKAQDIGHAVTMEINDPHLGVPLLITCSPFVGRDGSFAGSVHMARIQTSPATSHHNQPQHFIPICASCKGIRDEHGNWLKIEEYVSRRFNGQLTHSICSECQQKIYPEFFRS